MNMADTVSSQIGKALFVDDDPIILKAARLLMSRRHIAMQEATNIAMAREILAAEDFDVVLVDLNFARGAVSGEEGLQFIAEMVAISPARALIVVTAHSGVAIAVKAMRLGATDFITKPWRNDRLLQAVEEGMAFTRQRRLAAEQEQPNVLAPLIGESAAMMEVRRLIAQSAPTDAPVLIHGPTGSGRSLVAAHLHGASQRARLPLVTLDLASGPPEAIGERLRIKLEEAKGSTLLLRGIEHLAASSAWRLIAALETDVRLVTTSTRAPDPVGADETTRGLCYRLGTVQIALPPLAKRGPDIGTLARHYLRHYAARYGRTGEDIDAETLGLLESRDWPGNVTQLIQLVQRSIAIERPLRDLVQEADGQPIADDGTPDFNLDRLERRTIETVLARHGHNIARAAQELGLTRAALYRRMEKYGF